jgi:uncharacterized protein YbjQ (UPF0145 family)
MADVIQLIVAAVSTLFLLLLGWLCGSFAERTHFQSLRGRETLFRKMRITQLKSFPGLSPTSARSTLVTAEVVIASDYLKSFVAGLRKIIGGEMRSYLSLIERARREAVLRLAERARAEGYNAVCNIRMETSDIGGVSKGGKMAMVTLIASGTAYDAVLEGADDGSAA